MTIEWISTRERLPEWGERVLIGSTEDESVYEAYLVKSGAWVRDCMRAFERYVPTHWAKMPDAPRKELTQTQESGQ